MSQRKRPIDGWKAKEANETPTYCPEVALKPRGDKQLMWYERSQAQIKLLSQHKYAVKARS